MGDGELDIYSGDDDRDRLLRAAIQRIGPGKPVVIINLLRFRESADYTALTHAANSQVVKDNPFVSGSEAYFSRYIRGYEESSRSWFGKDHGNTQKILYLGKEMLPLLNGGRLPGEKDENYWHAVIMLQYPSIEAAANFQKSDVYWQASVHRVAALEDNVAWVTDPIKLAG